jgi:hypothetical protein
MSERYGPSAPEFPHEADEPLEPGPGGFRRYAMALVAVDWAVAVAVVGAALILGRTGRHELAAICALAGFALLGLGMLIAGGGSALGPTNPVHYAPPGYLPTGEPFPRDSLTTRVAGVLLGAAVAPIAAAVLFMAFG